MTEGHVGTTVVDEYNKVTDEVIRATTKKLVSTSMKPGQDRDEKTFAYAELAKMGEPTIFVAISMPFASSGFHPTIKGTKLIMYCDPILPSTCDRTQTCSISTIRGDHSK